MGFIDTKKKYQLLKKQENETEIDISVLFLLEAQEKRDELQKYLQSHGVDAKVHYPIPMHLQPAAKHLGYKKGDFPVCENICDTVLSLPVHEFVTKEDVEKVVQLIKNFF